MADMMKITTSIRKYLATALLTAGLAYPACAAVCPKGIGGCTSPGRCFLFTDTDGNSLCDYTARSSSSTPASSSVVQPATAQPTSAPANVQAVSDTASAQGTASTSASAALPFTVILAGVFLFIALCGIIYTSVRKGFLGIHIGQPGPALAFSSLVALGFSLMATSALSVGAIQSMVFALVYLVAGTLLAAYLWHAGVMSRRIVLALALVSTLAGFVFVAPIMPVEFIGIFSSIAGTSSITPAIIILCAVIILGVIIGRTFCGHICPVGSLQELAYAVPVKKIVIRNTGALEVIRLFVFAATILAAVYAIDLMAYTGVYALFSLAISATMIVGAAVILLSVIVYRPVCRILCPFGVLFSLFSQFSLFRLRRNGSCILCKKCEKACPAGCAGKEDSKRECYLCGRCTETCPVNGALTYRR
ncbi:MAG: 4Fe-4S binding protein [Methanoregula sp.]|nr:4Fe-4S binding protein [Methanoregula sp.]